jgi:tRNA uridine 5-carboxymethylaminomethyl modification enzyme
MICRPDNADLRLTEKGYEIGCVSSQRYEKFQNFKKKYDHAIEYLTTLSHSIVNWKNKVPQLPIHIDNPTKKNFIEILKLDGVTFKDLEKVIEPSFNYILEDKKLMERLKIYSVYSECENRQKDDINEIKKYESFILPNNFDYSQIQISNESKEKLFRYRPNSIGEASRLPGIKLNIIQ